MDCSDETKLKLDTDTVNFCNKTFAINSVSCDNDVSEESNDAPENSCSPTKKPKLFCMEQEFYVHKEDATPKRKFSVPSSGTGFQLLENKTTTMLTCEICQQQFTETSDLTQHLLGHISSRSSLQLYDFDSGIKKGSESSTKGESLVFSSSTKEEDGEVGETLVFSSSTKEEDGEVEESDEDEEEENEENNSSLTSGSLLTPQSQPTCPNVKHNNASNTVSISPPSSPPPSSSSSSSSSTVERALSVSSNPMVKQETSPAVTSEYNKKCKTQATKTKAQPSTGKKEIRCDICQQVFTRSSTLKRHLRIHTGEKPFVCEICHKSFFQSSDLTQHLRVHTGERPYKCDLCTAAFTQHSALTRHLRCHFGEKPYVCSVCQRAFSQSPALSRHMCSHSVEKLKKRSESSTKVKSLVFSPSIKEEDGGIDEYDEDEGQEYEENHSSLTEQMPIPLLTPQSEPPCPNAKQNNTSNTVSISSPSLPPSSSSSSSMVEIALSVSPVATVKPDTLPTVSSERNKKYKTQATKTKANMSNSEFVKPRTGEKRLTCEICQQVFTRPSALKRHLRIHSGEKPFSCEICYKSFFQSSDLTQHLRVHTGERPYKCDLCTAAFSQHSALTRHLRCHFGEKPYVCSVCQRAFSQSSALSRHMSSHAEEKLYICEICDKSFSWSEPLLRHMRTHTGEKPYKCEICAKSFSQTANLSTHMRVHSGEKPYSCLLCDRAFPTSSNLTRHMKTHNEKAPVDLSIPTTLLFDSLTEPTI